jgi:hypothetical protein
MVYGVDLATEIAYTYRMPDANNPGPPILDEIFYEERSSCGGEEEKGGVVEEDLDREGEIDGQFRDQSSIRSAVCRSEGMRCSESSTIINPSENTFNTNKNSLGRNSGDVKADVCSVLEMNEAVSACTLGETSLDKLNMNNKAKGSEEILKRTSNEQSSSQSLKNRTGEYQPQKPKDAIIPSSSIKKTKIRKKKSKRKKGDCNNEVYGIKTKEKGSRSFSAPQRNFLRNGKKFFVLHPLCFFKL